MSEAPYDLLVRLVHRFAPEVELDKVDHDESLQDVADLDSIDFLGLMSALYAETGIDVPERDYPSVASVDGFVAYVGEARDIDRAMTASAADDRSIQLGNGRHIAIRPVRRGDSPDLAVLYDGLDDDDHYRRFFSMYEPRPAFFDEMESVGERGGARVVAVLAGPSPVEKRIIGEAGYTRLPNGDGELAMTVARRWRGWLGPYLLDALVAIAAAAGIPNLEADVLTTNRPMLALLRARGSVVMEHQDWSVARLLIATGGRIPSWPGPHDRPRVLVESRGGRWHAEDDARAARLQLLTCTGPPDGLRGCPVLAGEPCPLAAEADVIVVSHPPDDDRWRELVRAHASVHPGVPVCLEPSHPPADDKVPVITCPVTKEADVVSFVTRLAEGTP
jgi:acyl carrier protein